MSIKKYLYASIVIPPMMLSALAVFYPLITGCVAGVCYGLGELLLPSGLVGVDPKYFGVAVFLAMLLIAYPYGLASMILQRLINTKN